MPAIAADKPIEIWFQDEARVGQQGTLSYLWARLAKGSVRRSRMERQGEGPRGSRPAVVRDNRHDSAYLFGAVCPDRAVPRVRLRRPEGRRAAIIMPSVNSEAMADHLAEVSTQVAAGAHAVVVCDGAGWHQRGERLPVPDNISLLPLPGYSPELNPVENVWEYLRANKLSSRVWGSYDAILNACRDAWNFLIRDPDRIRSIAYREWATVKI